MKTILLIYLCFVLICSCTQQEKFASATNNNDTTSVITDTMPVISEFKGLYNQQNKIFFTCEHPEISYKVNDKTKQLDSLYKSVLPASYDNQTVFIDVKGEMRTGKNNTVEVKEILKVEQKNYQNTCVHYDYWCLGTEPFWGIQISEKENLIDFLDPVSEEVPKFYHFPYFKAEIKKGIITYISENKSDKITIHIVKEKCNDGMSEREFNYKTEVILNGHTYNGCAIKYGETIKDPNN